MMLSPNAATEKVALFFPIYCFVDEKSVDVRNPFYLDPKCGNVGEEDFTKNIIPFLENSTWNLLFKWNQLINANIFKNVKVMSHLRYHLVLYGECVDPVVFSLSQSCMKHLENLTWISGKNETSEMTNSLPRIPYQWGNLIKKFCGFQNLLKIHLNFLPFHPRYHQR